MLHELPNIFSGDNTRRDITFYNHFVDKSVNDVEFWTDLRVISDLLLPEDLIFYRGIVS